MLQLFEKIFNPRINKVIIIIIIIIIYYRGATRRGRRELPLPFLKIEKSALILEKRP